MKSAFNKEIVRSIRNSAGRFLAIIIISFLGAGFYAGLRMAAPDMRIAGDDCFDAGNLYDISVMTTLGLDDGSIALLRNVEGVGSIMSVRRADAMVRVGENSFAASVESLPSGDDCLNEPTLIEGSWPYAVDECVIGMKPAEKLGIAIGDELSIEAVDGEIDDLFAQMRFRVTGFVNAPAYVHSQQMGTTSLGTGRIELYAFVPEGAFAKSMPYSAAYLAVLDAHGLQWGTPAYDETVSEVKRRIEAVSSELADERTETVKRELRDELVGVIQKLSVELGWDDDIETPDVFVMDRTKNAGAKSLASDADGIQQIATFLPFMFFLVAALVSLTSMTRMVDEERVIIGTHKALGYNRGQITLKYLVYGALASGIGAGLGIFVLGQVLPWFIMTSYQVNYALPTTPTPIDASIALQAIILSVGITVVATWGAAAASLREKPAALMLPRAPKAGKRIILERIRPLWSRLSFSWKITARNLLRYKRRFFMAVTGVAGCTALLMVGFGLRDAIGTVVSNQFGELVSYDAVVRIDNDAPVKTHERVASVLNSDAVEAQLLADGFNLIAVSPQDDVRIEVIVPEDSAALPDFMTLRSRTTGEPLTLEGDEIILTEKAAETLGLHSGDKVALFDENEVGDKTGDGRTFTVSGIAENYLGHYAYLLPQGYRKAFDKEPRFDVTYVKLADNVNPSVFSDELLSIDGVSTVSFVSDNVAIYEDVLALMGTVIIVVILLSAALAFVVLYNLTNINIAERIREVATLKVLGFTRSEVSGYIFREVIVMTFIGALVGCVLGMPLTGYIAAAAETAQMMFGRIIEPTSFALSFVITMAFSIIVTLTMRPKLNQVNMVESLKSTE